MKQLYVWVTLLCMLIAQQQYSYEAQALHNLGQTLDPTDELTFTIHTS